MSQLTNHNSIHMISEDLWSNNILICKCNSFHEFYIIFEDNFYLNFQCDNKIYKIKLDDFFHSNDFKLKCYNCDNIINITKDYYHLINKTDGIFICSFCYKNNTNFLNNTSKLSNTNTKNNEFQSIINKIDNIPNNSNKLKQNKLYEENNKKLMKLKEFLLYLNNIRNYFPYKSKYVIIIENLFYYLDRLLINAIKYIQLYDIYHFNKECIIYGDYYREKEFLNDKFNKFYKHLLEKCNKNKVLSIEMFDYIRNNYTLLSLEEVLKKKDKLYLKKIFEKNKNKDGISKYLLELEFNFSTLQSLIEQTKNKEEIVKLKYQVSKLSNELKLNQYLNSYFNEPSEFAFIRKNINIILAKIISNNKDKLNSIKPNEKIINLSLLYIKNLKRQISDNKNKEYKDIKKSIINKLEQVEKIFNDYKFSLISNRNNNLFYDDEKKNLKMPLINYTDKEKEFLVIVNKSDDSKRHYVKIMKTVNRDENPYLEFIIDYLFTVKEDLNQIFHLNDKKYYNFFINFKKNEESISPDNSDDLEKAIQKIKETISLIPKITSLSYKEMIKYTFYSPKDSFIDSKDKIEKLLCFLDIDLTKLKDISEQYKSKKKNLKILKIKIKKKIEDIMQYFDSEKYNNLNEKYQIKLCYNDLIKYLDIIFNKSFPDIAFDEEIDSDEDSESDKKEENNLKQKLNILLKYDNKIFTFIQMYFQKKVNDYIKKKKDNIINDIKEAIKIINDNNFLYLKIKYIEDIIKELELYNFDLKDHFEKTNIKKYFPKIEDKSG